MKFFLVLCSLFFSIGAHSKSELIQFDVTGRKHQTYSLKTVCENLGHKHNLIVDRENQLQVDCMGKKVKVGDFCTKKSFSAPFLRGFIPRPRPEEKPRAFCVTGKQARLKLSCESKKTRSYCRYPQKSCEKLRPTYAFELEVMHSSRKVLGGKETLRCYFGQKESMEVEDVMSPSGENSQ